MKKQRKIKYKDRKVRVGQYDWDLVYVDQLENPNSVGLCEFSSKRLSVLKGLSAEIEQEALCHELFHAFCDEYGHTQYMDEQKLEALAETVARLFTSQFWLIWKN